MKRICTLLIIITSLIAPCLAMNETENDPILFFKQIDCNLKNGLSNLYKKSSNEFIYVSTKNIIKPLIIGALVIGFSENKEIDIHYYEPTQESHEHQSIAQDHWLYSALLCDDTIKNLISEGNNYNQPICTDQDFRRLTFDYAQSPLFINCTHVYTQEINIIKKTITDFLTSNKIFLQYVLKLFKNKNFLDQNPIKQEESLQFHDYYFNNIDNKRTCHGIFIIEHWNTQDETYQYYTFGIKRYLNKNEVGILTSPENKPFVVEENHKKFTENMSDIFSNEIDAIKDYLFSVRNPQYNVNYFLEID